MNKHWLVLSDDGWVSFDNEDAAAKMHCQNIEQDTTSYLIAGSTLDASGLGLLHELIQEKPATYTAHDGYEDAAKIDEILDSVLNNHDPDDESNRLGYLALIRTVHTTLNIIRPRVGLKQTGTHMVTVVPE